MRYTLLDYVQLILASMDSDEVNSIADSSEAQQVANIVKTTYYDIVAKLNLPRDYRLFQLTPSNNSDQPVTMTLPDNIGELGWVRYNIATAANPEYTMRELRPLPLVEFLDMTLGLNQNDTTVKQYTQVINMQPMLLQCRNDRAPEYYTTFNDRTILFDSYDAAVDVTLQASKTLCYGEKVFPWNNDDNFTPEMDDKQHQLLLNEAKSMCFLELKQTTHLKAEKNSRTLWIDQQSAKTKIPLKTALQRTPNYGR